VSIGRNRRELNFPRMSSSAPARPASAAPSGSPVAHPPETLEGWYALHQIFSIDPSVADGASAGVTLPAAAEGWSAAARLIGSSADMLVVHFRPTLDEIGAAQAAFAKQPAVRAMRLVYSFLSITEAGLYHLSAQLAREAAERGGAVGDPTYTAELEQRAAGERESPHVQRRLYPAIPDGMPYICFYPMNKRRDAEQNWYTLSLEERSRLMQAHGTTGRRYAGRVVQVISGAIGLDAWEWGVTLFARDPLDFKKLVTDMRFDEVSARYAEFGDFYVGRLASGAELSALR
jgi:hydrogen peroxide-dependent heme synthase